MREKFRFDINALRALSVISVVIYHFMPDILPGGFVGVDVFFVISGYLMTMIIIRGVEDKNFSFVEFYSSRVRRIVPALLIMSLFLIVFGYFYLTIYDFRNLGKHIASSVIFVSNVIYQREIGYFDSQAQSKWLLHTWSLSVEWQFYILYPIALVAMKRKMINIKKMMPLITIVFFLCSIFISKKNPDSSYYSLLCRVWEMLLGSLAFFYPINKNKPFACIFGGVSLFFSLVFFDKNILWPSIYTLVPTLGAYLIIASNFNFTLFNTRVVNIIGRNSYSIYLWHWPVKVFIFYSSLQGYLYACFGVLFSLFVGHLSYEFIEKKGSKGHKSKTILEFITSKTTVCMITIFSISIYIYVVDGIKDRNINNLLNIQKSPYHTSCNKKNCEYFSDSPSWAVIGDSHSKELAYSLAQKLKRNGDGVKEYSFAGCGPSYKARKSNDCTNWHNQIIDQIINDNEIENIVILYRYSSYHENYINNLNSMIMDLSEKKKRIILFTPIPKSNSDVNINAFYNNAFNNDKNDLNIISQSKLAYLSENSEIREYLLSSNLPKNVEVIDIMEFYCSESECYSILNGIPLYFDDNHPSLMATKRIVDKIN